MIDMSADANANIKIGESVVLKVHLASIFFWFVHVDLMIQILTFKVITPTIKF